MRGERGEVGGEAPSGLAQLLGLPWLPPATPSLLQLTPSCTLAAASPRAAAWHPPASPIQAVDTVDTQAVDTRFIQPCSLHSPSGSTDTSRSNRDQPLLTCYWSRWHWQHIQHCLPVLYSVICLISSETPLALRWVRPHPQWTSCSQTKLPVVQRASGLSKALSSI